jgi:hypothetical protein
MLPITKQPLQRFIRSFRPVAKLFIGWRHYVGKVTT